MFISSFLFVACGGLLVIADDFKNPHMAENRHTIVHLFEWKWNDIADECERFLGPFGYGGVQTSPPNENAIIVSPPDTPNANRPWWERYQSVSYKLVTRSGTEEEFAAMVKRCNKVGIRIYPDVVINHMTGGSAKGRGTGGSSFDGGLFKYDEVPYSANDFNSCEKCGTGSCNIENFNDENQLHNCRLVGLNDLNQGSDYVRNKIAGFLNHVIDLGVAGFRVDAAKHMWPTDASVIYSKLKNLNTEFFPAGSRPFIYQEVPDVGSQASELAQYLVNGRITEFKFGLQLGEVFRRRNPMKYLQNYGEEWGLVKSEDAFVFLDNHDNQRDANPHVLTHYEARNYKMAAAFMLSWPYGVARVMSSFLWDRNIQGGTDTNSWQGPPHDEKYNILSPTINADMTCGNGWVCEHRWRQIYNMVQFRNVVAFQDVKNWWDNGSYQIAFSRGSKGFIAINNDDYPLKVTIQTGLPSGQYCDIISGNYKDGKCSGKIITIENDGKVNLDITNAQEDPMIALHVSAKVN